MKDIRQIELESTLRMILLVCEVAVNTPTLSTESVKELLYEIDRTETLLPILDPTSYMQKSGNIRSHKIAVKAFGRFLEGLEEIREELRPVHPVFAGYRCTRCRHEWVPMKSTAGLPRVCPRCKSPYWKEEPLRQSGPDGGGAS